MARCEDYPCCGHGPPPYGDGGGCPDSQGRFKCVECGRKMPRDASSAICSRCRHKRATMDPDELDLADRLQDAYDESMESPW